MIQYKNNAASNLLSGITDTDLSLTVGSGEGELFPALSGDDVFFVTLSGTIGYEIVKVTARSTDTFTIVRAQEGTTAKAFAMGDKVEMLITAGHFEDLRDNSLRYDSLPTDPIAGLNAEKIDGIRSNEFHLKRTNLTLLDPLILDFGSSNREDIVLNKQYAGVDNEWEKVVLLLSMSGANNSTVFTDSSIQQNTITGFGNAKISTAQFKFGSSSAYFDGSGDYLRLPYTSNLSLQGDFTVEAWFNVTTFTGGPILSKDTYGSNFDFSLQIANSTTLACYTNSTNSNLTVTVPAMSTGTWYHVAFVRYNGTNTFYLNGTSYGSNSMNITNSSQSYLTIGCFGWNNPNVFFNGYIQDLRITKSARYTSNFTPPSSSFTTSSWIDQIYDPYYLNTSLLLHFNGTSGSQVFTDDSVTPKSITAYGNAQISSIQSKFGGVSGYFDGNGDYLTAAHNSHFIFGTEDFTIEAWLYLMAYSSVDFGCIFTTAHPSDYQGIFFSISSSDHKIYLHLGNGSTWVQQVGSSSTVSLNTWTHVALTRQSDTFRIFQDGTKVAEWTNAINLPNTNNLITAGGRPWASQYSNMYMDEARITKGIARYTSNFTPATLPFAGIKNLTVDQNLDKVSLLLHFNGSNLSTSFIDSSPSTKAITVYGDAKISTTQSKFGGSSAYFDGTGDYLQIPDSTDFNFGSGDFTIECWICPTQAPSPAADIVTSNGASNGCGLRLDGNLFANFIYNIGGTSSHVPSTQALPLNQWTHLAAVRFGSSAYLFVNGVPNSNSCGAGSQNYPGIGFCVGRNNTNSSWYFTGYLDEIRITKGVARYTTSFTPPPVPFVDGNKTISIGTQSNTLYQRSSGNFAWYKDGSYSGIDLDPGLNGSVRMVLNEAGNLLIGKTTDNGEGLLQVNGTISASSLNISGASNVNASQLGGVSSASYVRTDYDSIIKDPYTLSFGSGSREVLYLAKQAYPDVYFSYVKLLMHCDGTNNSTTLLDSSLNSRTITPYYNSKLSTTQQKFGVSSLYQDGTDDYVTFNSSDIDLGSSDFTIEFWVYPTATGSGYRRFIGYEQSTQAVIVRDNNGSFQAFVEVSGTFYNITTSTPVTLNTWQHIAFVRSGNVFTLYKNGTSIGTMTQAITIQKPNNNIWYIGWPVSETIQGYIDEIRVTQGIARYTSNFTPDVIPFPDYVSGNDYDPYYGYVSLLLHGIGNEGGTLFYDSSPTPKTATVGGNTSTRTAQFKFPTSSIYFDGSGDYLSFANDAAFNMGSSDFTIECWVNFSAIASSGGYNNIICKRYLYTSNNSYILYYAGTGSIVFDASFNGTSSGVSSSYSIIPTLNTWYHVAAVRSGSSLILYVNGVPGTTGNAGSSSLYTNTEALKIGAGDYANINNLNGYIQDVRITKGIARYTAAFNPPARLFPDRASLLLDPYFDKVSLLMHFHGANASTSFIDSSLLSLTVTPSGDAKISTTQSKFGGSSAYFDGTGDYLTIPKTTDFDFGSGDFAIEMWCYLIDYNTSGYPRGLWSTGKESGLDYYSTRLHVTDTKKLLAVVSTNGTSASYITDADDFTLNTWHHVALVRYGNTVTLYKDGISVGTPQTISGSIYYSTAYPVCISNLPDYGGMGYNNKWYGYIDEVRITKGIARYTANFTIPQAPFADAPVVYSLGVQNGGMYSRSSTGRFDWYMSGNHSPISGNPGVNGTTLMGLVSASSGSTILSILPKAISGAVASIEVGWGRTIDGYAYIDLIGDSTYSDFGLRIIRNNTGANTSSGILHCGTGDMVMTAIHAAPIILGTSSTERLRITSGGRVLIGAGADDSTNLLQVNGNLAFIGSGRRIVGDFSNATQANQVGFQTSTTNGGTYVLAAPNGTGSNASLYSVNSSSVANCGYMSCGITSSYAYVHSSKFGTGTTLPLAFMLEGLEKMRLDTSGNLGIGVSPSTPLHVSRSTVSAEVRLEGGSTSGSVNTSAINFYQSSTNQWQISKRSSGWGGRANNFEISYYNGSWTDKLGITTAGRVGIGHTLVQSGTIDNLLHLYSTGYDGLKIEVENSTAGASQLIFSSGSEPQFGQGAVIQLNTASHSTEPNNWIFANRTTGVTRFDVASSAALLSMVSEGRILIGTSTDDGTNLLQVNGDQAFIGTGRRIRGDFSNATQSSRVLFQSSTTNGNTAVGLIPNGSSRTSNVNCFSNPDPTNTSFIQMLASDTETRISSGVTGTGTALPLNFYMAGIVDAVMRISTAGRLLIGTTVDDTYNTVQIVGDNTSGGLIARTYGVNGGSPNSALALFGSRGTIASPTAIQSSDRLGILVASSQYSNSASRNVASIQFYATENHDTTHAGTKIVIDSCINGSTGRTERIICDGDGRIIIGGSSNDDTNLLQVKGSMVQSPLASVTPANNGELVFEATNNTTITVKYKGSDGTVRSGTITLT